MVLRCGGAVLQDLAVAVADAAADAYLAEAGVSRQGRQLRATQSALVPASSAHCMAISMPDPIMSPQACSRVSSGCHPAIRAQQTRWVAHVVCQSSLASGQASPIKLGRGAFAGRSQGTRGPHKAAASWLLVLHPRLTTTRALERFRNQVAMQRWMDANFGSVTAMYEDRHQLWGFNHKGRLLQRTLPARRAQVLTAHFSPMPLKLVQARLKVLLAC